MEAKRIDLFLGMETIDIRNAAIGFKNAIKLRKAPAILNKIFFFGGFRVTLPIIIYD